jgi:predicted amidophosphoribosyltransferase
MRLVRAAKYQGSRPAMRWLARLIVATMSPAAVAARGLLVAVPTPSVRIRERGWDHTEELARELGRLLGWPVRRLLRRRGWRPPLAGLGHEARAEVLRGAFATSRRLGSTGNSSVPIFLVDDVVTTGATLRACAAAFPPELRPRLSALVGARTRRLVGGDPDR